MKYNWLVCLILILSSTSMSAASEPASKESVKTLMERTGAGQMMKQMLPTLKKMAPGASEKFWIDVMAESNSDQLIEMIIPIYQKHLTEEDIKGIIAFYDTPAGKNFIKAQPQIMQESMLLGQKWGQEIASKVISKYKARPEPKP